jgi:hypothetical protein
MDLTTEQEKDAHTMVSIRESIQKVQAIDEHSVVSLGGLAQQIGLDSFMSLRELAKYLDPEQITFKTGEAKVGDVKGWGEWTLFSNGYWMFRGHLHDSGTLVGDYYTLVMSLNYVGASGEIISVKQEGKLGAVVGGSRDVDWEQRNRNAEIAANWSNIIAQGCTWRLHTDPDLKKLGAVLGEIVLTLGGVGIMILVATNSSNNSDCYVGYDPIEEKAYLTCPVKH